MKVELLFLHPFFHYGLPVQLRLEMPEHTVSCVATCEGTYEGKMKEFYV